MFINDIFENDDMFAGSQRVPDQIRQDRHPLRDYLDYDDYKNLMDEFDDAILHTQNQEEIDEYLAALTRAGIGSNFSLFYDIIENYILGIRTGIKAENDEKLHYNLNDAFRRTWTENKPHITIRFLIRAMSQACVAAIHAADDEDDDDLYESEDDMFAASDRANKINAVIIAGHEEFLTQSKIKQSIKDYCRERQLKILGTAKDAYMLDIYVRATPEELLDLIEPLERLADKQDMNVTMINGVWDMRTKKPFFAESADDMFTGTTVGTVLKWYNKLDELCDATGNNADEMLRFDSDTWSKIHYNTVDLDPASIIAQANEEQRKAIINDIKGFISDIQSQEGVAESEDDMFAAGRFQTWKSALKEILDGLYAEEEQNLQVNMEPKHVRATEQLMSDYDYLRSELERAGMQGFIHGLDMVEQYAINSIDADLARKGIKLSDIEKAFFPEKFNESEDEDMFAPGNLQKWTKAIKEILDHEYNHYSHQYNIADPEDTRWTKNLVEWMRAYDFLRNELQRAGIKGFLDGLGKVSRDITDATDAVLAVRYKIHLSDIENAFYPEKFNESEDDMFAQGSKISKDVQNNIKATDYLTQHLPNMSSMQAALEVREKLGKRWAPAEPLILQDPGAALLYAKTVIKGRWPEAEAVILDSNPSVAFFYALDVVKGPWPEAEPLIAQEATPAYAYANHLLRGPFPAGEAAIAKDPHALANYKELVNGVEEFKPNNDLRETDDDMFSDNRVVINPRGLSKITKILADKLEKYADDIPADTAETYLNDAVVLRRASNAFLSGLRAGFKELEDIEDSSTWEYLEDLANRYDIDLSELADKYDAGELSESEDDEMFAPPQAERIGIELQKLANEFRQYQHSEQSEYYCRKLGNIFRTQGLDKGVWAWHIMDPHTGGISTTVSQVVYDRIGFDIASHYLDLDPKRMRGEYDLDENEDDMFSDKPSILKQFIEFLEDYGYNALDSARVCDSEEDTQYYLNKSDQAYIAASVFKTQGFNAGVEHFKRFSDQFGHEPEAELLDDYGIELDSLNETVKEDDMFSTNRTLAQRIGDAFVDRGESDLDWADTLTGDERHGDYAHELKLRGVKFIETGKAFNERGIQAGLMELMLIDHEARQEFYNFMKEVEGWDIEQTIQQLIGGLNESEDDGLFAKTPVEKFVDGLRAYQNTIEQDITQQHPSWADHPHTVEQRRILTRVQILIEQISNPQTMLQGLNLLAKYINSPSGGWTSDIEEFLLDNKFPTIYDMLTRYNDRLDESADELFSEPRNVASFDKFFKEIVPGASEDLLDDFAGYLYDFDTPEAIDKINEQLPDNIMITHARWDDEKDDWYFTFKRL